MAEPELRPTWSAPVSMWSVPFKNGVSISSNPLRECVDFIYPLEGEVGSSGTCYGSVAPIKQEGLGLTHFLLASFILASVLS